MGATAEVEGEGLRTFGSGDGARFALLSLEKRSEASWVADVVEYVELATDPDFQREYVEAMHFPPPVPPVPGVARPA